MNRFFLAKSLILLTISFFFLSACGIAGGGLMLNWGNSSGYGQGQLVSETGKKGPPSHAVAHGYRAKYQYRFYPSCSVYYDTGRGVYFYLNGDNWQISESLPKSLQVSLGSHVSIEMNTDRPYVSYEEHKIKYPPGQQKKKYSKKTKKKKRNK